MRRYLYHACTLALLLGGSWRTTAQEIAWIAATPAELVAESHGFTTATVNDRAWEADTSAEGDPWFILAPVDLDTDQARFLYLQATIRRECSVQLFLSPEAEADFVEERSLRFHLPPAPQDTIYRIPLESFAVWQGQVRRLRLDLDGLPAGWRVQIMNVGWGTQPVTVADRQVVEADPTASTPRHLSHRMAAFHKTMTAVSENVPNASVNTYARLGGNGILSHFLAKLVPLVEIDGVMTGPTQAWDTQVEDEPGRVVTEFRIEDTQVRTVLTPLLVGRGAEEWEGAAVFEVETTPARALVLAIGAGPPPQMGQNPDLGRDALLGLSNPELNGDLLVFEAPSTALAVAASASGELLALEATSNGTAAGFRSTNGRARITLAFAETGERAATLARENPEAALAEVEGYYRDLLRNRISTPVREMDQAFRSALYNLEYNWLEPYGWNECINHWLAMWHNQHTAGAEWIGQEDRSRTCTAYLGHNLLPSGAIPQFLADGRARRDFGGSNQFWAWQARHYWHFTGDLEFVREMTPALDTVLEQTLDEHDPDRNLLIGWGLQIGNQEDFIQFYHDGGTPSIELVNMMRTRVTFAEALGDTETAELWKGRIRQTLSLLRRKLWLPDLGRFAAYVDEADVPRLDAQYHTFLYPAIWDVVDDLDAYPGLRQVQDRLQGPDGEVYCSNNFPNHVAGTWGMQAGAAQQPWAAWGFAALGQAEEVWRPLAAVARWVMDPNHRGSWPEISTEPTPSYFTPPAGLYIAAVVEALFGLQVDVPARTLRVAPAFPEHWPEAELRLKRFAAAYTRNGTALSYRVRSEQPLRRELAWSLPPCRVVEFQVNGVPTAFTLTPGIGTVTLRAETPEEVDTHIALTCEPLDVEVQAPGSVAEGDPIRVVVDNARILAVDDRCGVLERVVPATDNTALDARVRQGLLEPYLGYGRLGQLTFSRRTFFLECRAGEVTFRQPVNLTVLPRYEAAQVGELALDPADSELEVTVRVRNNTAERLSGPVWLEVARHQAMADVELEPRSETQVRFTLPLSAVSLFAYGENHAWLRLPTDHALPVVIEAVQVLTEAVELRDLTRTRLVDLPIPEADTSPYTDWAKLRLGSHGGPVPWIGWQQPLAGAEDVTELRSEDLPELVFHPRPGRWVLVGQATGRPFYRLPVPERHYRKFHLLTATFADNHDMYTRIADVRVNGSSHNIVATRALHMPGDLDWWEPHGMLGSMSTTRLGRPDRHGLLPLLPVTVADWEEGLPPAFPQPRFWTDTRTARLPNCTLNVVEIPLAKAMPVTSIEIQTHGICPGLALFAAVADTGDGDQRLARTPFRPSPEFRSPLTLFRITDQDSLQGWQIEGFELSNPLNAGLTLNSLTPGGETATGRAMSPAFVIGPDWTALEVEIQGGHNSHDTQGEHNRHDTLSLRLVDAETGEVAASVDPPGTHALTWTGLHVHHLRDRRVRLELLDLNTNTSFAWIGIRQARVTLGE